MNSNAKSNANEVVNDVLSRISDGSVDKKHKNEKAIGVLILSCLAILLFVLNYFSPEAEKPNLAYASEVSTTVTNDGRTTVSVPQEISGHYIFLGEINGKKVKFVLDTGATRVAVPKKMSSYLGLFPGKMYQANTANGVTESYHTIIKSLKIGGLFGENIQAAILPGLEGDEILLGMSFLKDFEMTQEGGKLKITQLK